MLLAAQKRGWELWYAGAAATSGCATASPWAAPRPVTVRDDLKDWFTLGDGAYASRWRTSTSILMRKDPPFDMEYIYTTYILERAEQQGALVVNRPQGLRDMNEKVFTAWFPQCCAPTLITRDMADMHALPARARALVCKPLVRHGRPLDLRRRARRQECERHLRDDDRVRHALRDRAALHSRHRDHRRLAHPRHRRRARAVRARAHPDARPTTAAISPPARRGEGRELDDARPLARRADRPDAARARACCSSAST